MNCLPLIPQNEDHEILPLIHEILQNSLCANKYPRNVAENYQKYIVDGEFTDQKNRGLDTVKVFEALEPRMSDILDVEEELMRNHALAMIQKEQNLPLIENLRLKRFDFFQKLSDNAAQTYELIQREDLYPNKIEQYLDFTYNPSLHTCDPCIPDKTVETKPTVKKKQWKCDLSEPEVTPPFKAEPHQIIFWNYELGQVYRQKFKLINTTRSPQNFNYYLLPKDSPYRLKILTESQRVAPGMSAEFLVEFRPESFQNYTEFIKFRTIKGADLNVVVSSARDSPKLICYIYNPFLPWYAVRKPGPGSKYFSERRRTALNFTIDCGTCLLGNYSLITLIMKNQGNRGRFLITTENEWVFSELSEKGTRACEISQGCFTIFPALFDIDSDDIEQIAVAFVPDKVGVFTEKFVIICDNNAHLEIEILGDCILYSDKFLKVNMYLLQNTFSYNNRSITITLAPKQTSSVIFSILNNSPIYFNYYWLLKTSTEVYNKKKMNPDWIKILYGTQFLPTFSTTDVVVQLTPDTEAEENYDAFTSINDLQFNHKCDSSCIDEQENGAKLFTHSQLGDVHIFELEINCIVKLPEPVKLATVNVSLDFPSQGVSPSLYLRLSKSVLNFGIIPKGVFVSRSINVENLTDDDIDWKIMEIHCTDKSYLCVSSEAYGLDQYSGTLKGKHKKNLNYTIEAKEATRWVSILILFSCPSCTCQNFTLESVCIIAYQVAEINISIRTDNQLHVLCPREFIYVEIPTLYTIYVHNSGLVVGCFYFLKPTGDGADKLRLRFHPQSGVVQPGATVDVKVELTALNGGIFDNIYVPCFIGDPERLIALRILCSVATINLHFYLPDEENGYNRYIWPPKSEMPVWDHNTASRGEDGFFTTDKGECVSDSEGGDDLRNSLLSLIGTDSVAATYPTIKTKQIEIRKATKLTFYFENLTPVKGHFTVEASNYGPAAECLNHILVKAKTRTPEFFWEKACLDGYGIVIEPIYFSGDIIPYEVIEIDLWIYANTWGKYLEEIIVEINDLTPFCFNLMVEVVGLPVVYPFARNTTLPCPTLRFENIAYATESTTSCFTVTNISAVPIQISWHTYYNKEHKPPPSAPVNFLLNFNEDDMQFVMSHDYYGCEACNKCITMKPWNLVLDAQETATVSVTISASGFNPIYETTKLKYTLVGFIGLRNTDKFKENYYKRLSGVDYTPTKVEVLVTMELPIMQVDISSDETIIDIFVNDLLIKHQKIPTVYLILRNVDMSSIVFSIEIEKPFKIIEARTIPGGITDKKNLTLARHECLQVAVTCYLTCQDLLDYSEFIYKSDDKSTIENYTSVISKDLNVFQQGAKRQMIPFQVRLHYPQIEVKPAFIRFGECFLFRTKKSMISIYNMTGALTSFEIVKTTEHDDFEVQPSCALLEANTGLNKQFVDIAVYFTPRHCKTYMATLRIITNIPQYFIDVPVTGHGSNNEKFYTD
ncbi:uncharacterized protein LOC123015940 isoform X2 [Tribolium madens]|uniref:uncharacterized protein LOC123015940 isoform X2 n=1 Tax=Tribolium madens TaxID=41895 RepID=UPI001CF759E2|nr:uncharacterized protein LOC123015940 isoform X2 [Tribolium madens]